MDVPDGEAGFLGDDLGRDDVEVVAGAGGDEGLEHALVAHAEVDAARQGLVVVEAMKMENELRSPKDGRVSDVLVAEGASVEAGRLLVVSLNMAGGVPEVMLHLRRMGLLHLDALTGQVVAIGVKTAGRIGIAGLGPERDEAGLLRWFWSPDRPASSSSTSSSPRPPPPGPRRTPGASGATTCAPRWARWRPRTSNAWCPATAR